MDLRDGEQARPVAEYGDLYHVTSHGRVWSEQKGGWLAPILQGTRRGHEYYRVALYRDGQRKMRPIHHLVIEAFIGPRPVVVGVNKIEINHIDGNSLNNTPENLEYCTQAHNTQHAYDVGLRKKVGKTDSKDPAKKIALRKFCLDGLDPREKIWVPFCGIGEVSSDYPFERVIGCDVDLTAIRWWREHRPQAKIMHIDAMKFNDWGEEKYGYADIDSYGQPWTALTRFLTHAPLADTVHIAVTDGSALKIFKNRVPYDFDRGRFARVIDTEAANEQIEKWPSDAVKWLRGLGHEIEEVRDARARMGGSIPILYAAMRIRPADPDTVMMRRMDQMLSDIDI